MWKSGHNWPDLRRHLPSLKIAPRIWASSCLIGKSLFGNVCLPLTNRPATAADLCIKNTLLFFSFSPFISEKNKALGWKTAPESFPTICFKCRDVLSTLSVLGNFVCLKESICFLPAARQDKQNSVPAKSNTAGKARGLKVKSFVK